MECAHITASACTIISTAGALRTRWISCATPFSSGDSSQTTPLAYHNRLREPDCFDMFERCGLTPVWHERTLLQRDLDALRAHRVDEKFVRYSAEQNAASELFVDLVRAL